MGGVLSGTEKTFYVDTASIDADDWGIISSAFGTVESNFGGLRGMVWYRQVYDIPQNADVQVWGVSLSPSLGGSTIPDGTGGGYMRINSAYLDGTHQTFIWNVALHEVMHTANFHDAAAGCTTQTQMAPSMNINGPYPNGPTGTDYCAADAAWRGDVSPILISIDGTPIRLSSRERGVEFDLRGIGRVDTVAWPIGTNVGFLAFDRNGNGVIDSGAELFGNFTRLQNGQRAVNGYAALAEFDDNADGVVDRSDSRFGQLRIWVDRNRDGLCDPDELLTLSDAGISALSLRYRESRRVDRWGNEFRFYAPITPTRTGKAWRSWDVYLLDRPVFTE